MQRIFLANMIMMSSFAMGMDLWNCPLDNDNNTAVQMSAFGSPSNQANYQGFDRLSGNYPTVANEIAVLAKTIKERTGSACDDTYIREEVMTLAQTDTNSFKQLQSYQAQQANQTTVSDTMYKIALAATQKESIDNKNIAEQNAKKRERETRRADRNQWIALGGTTVAILMMCVLNSLNQQQC